MTTYRRFNFEWPGTWHRGRYEAMEATLQTQCTAYHWYSDWRLEGEPFGRLSISITVAARDQWWALKRACDVAWKVFRVGGVRPPYPTWEKLAWDAHRKGRPPREPASSDVTQ